MNPVKKPSIRQELDKFFPMLRQLYQSEELALDPTSKDFAELNRLVMRKMATRVFRLGVWHFQITSKGRDVAEQFASRSKYGNHRTEIDGIVFDSNREAVRYQQLLRLQSAGQIRNLQRQVRYRIMVGQYKVCTYIADFVYDEMTPGVGWRHTVEDCKGMRTDVYKLKARLMEAVYGIKVKET